MTDCKHETSLLLIPKLLNVLLKGTTLTDEPEDAIAALVIFVLIIVVAWCTLWDYLGVVW